MIFNWESRREKILKGTKILALKKLEGLRLMNDLADRVLSKRQKIMRQKLRERL
ncbi:MAG: hypothetical protein Q8N49_00500 [Candidatus Omnitrophota bacterium]|nr:hypothetical protein [Candidatus Omnitrophota bacterium]